MEFRRLSATFGLLGGEFCFLKSCLSDLDWIHHQQHCVMSALKIGPELRIISLSINAWVRKIPVDERTFPRAMWWELIYVCLTQQENETQHRPPCGLSPAPVFPVLFPGSLTTLHTAHNSEPAAWLAAVCCRLTECSGQTEWLQVTVMSICL